MSVSPLVQSDTDKTLRDQMAIAAMQALVIAQGPQELFWNNNRYDLVDRSVTASAYAIADAMLAARKRAGEKPL